MKNLLRFAFKRKKHMKKYCLLIVFLSFFKLIAQDVPMGFNYQSIVRDAVGLPVTNQSVNLRISLHQNTPSGTINYQETHLKTTNQFGLVNLVIGQGTVLVGSTIGMIDFSLNKYFIQVEVFNNPSWIDLGTAEFQSVPYAIQANNTLKIQNTSVSGIAPTNGQILQFNSTTQLWEPTLVQGVSLNSQTADVTVTGTTFNIGTASGISFGILNPVDFNNFNNKVSSQWTSTSTGLNSGIVFNNGNVSIGTNDVSTAKLKVNGDISAKGMVISSQSMNATGSYNTTSPTTIYKQRIYIPQGTENLEASFNAYEFVSIGGSTLTIWINNIQVGSATLSNPNDPNTPILITDIPVSTYSGSFQTLEIKAQTTLLAQGVILQGYTLVIKN